VLDADAVPLDQTMNPRRCRGVRIAGLAAFELVGAVDRGAASRGWGRRYSNDTCGTAFARPRTKEISDSGRILSTWAREELGGRHRGLALSRRWNGFVFRDGEEEATGPRITRSAGLLEWRAEPAGRASPAAGFRQGASLGRADREPEIEAGPSGACLSGLHDERAFVWRRGSPGPLPPSAGKAVPPEFPPREADAARTGGARARLPRAPSRSGGISETSALLPESDRVCDRERHQSSFAVSPRSLHSGTW